MSVPAWLKMPLTSAMAMVVIAALLFHLFQRQLSSAWLAFGMHPQTIAVLEASLADQRTLARLDPPNAAAYRQRFDALETLSQRLRILEHSRNDIVRRYEQLLLLLFAIMVVVLTGGAVLRRGRDETRLGQLEAALADLAAGRTDIEVHDRRRDTIGRIAMMIERTSRRMARDRRRLAALKNLSAWQEAARRHAHEMRTPLTAARLDLGRLDSMLADEALERGADIHQAAQSAHQELEQLGRFAQRFTSFARLPRPELRRQNIAALVDEFVATFTTAWPNLALEHEANANGQSTEGNANEVDADEVDADEADANEVEVDRDMVRQVLVNLCDNSAQALGEGESNGDGEKHGRVRFTLGRTAESVLLEVADNGPGVPEAVRARLFEPYTTTRSIGEGMGLGLAICRKILLDHDGDLELAANTSAGATFRLILPRPARRGDDPETPS